MFAIGVSKSAFTICVVNITQEKEHRERENMFAIGISKFTYRSQIFTLPVFSATMNIRNC